MVKRTCPAKVWRWMKLALAGGPSSFSPCCGRHLDEVAEHVVVPDLERADAGLVGVARLQGRDHAARFVAQAPRLVERGLVAGAHEAAVALDQRQLVGERAGQQVAQRPVRGAASAVPAAAMSAGSSPIASSRSASSAAAASPSRIAARSRGPPRPTTRRVSERARSGAALRAARISCRASGSATNVSTASRRAPDGVGIGQRGREALCQEPRRRPPSRCDRWRQGASRAARPRACAMSSRLVRVAASICSVVPAASRAGGDSGGRLPSCVRST